MLQMDYNSSELRGFFSMFKKAFNESADDSLAAAETKIMRIVALSATGAIILVVLLTLALAFALRLAFLEKVKLFFLEKIKKKEGFHSALNYFADFV